MPNVLAEKSTKTWEEGTDCLKRGLVNSAANRLYYAVFQAVKGFAIQRDMMTMDSSDNVHRIALQIVANFGTGRAYFRKRLNQLVAQRIIADYKVEDVDPERLKDLLDDAEKIRKYYIKLAGTEI